MIEQSKIFLRSLAQRKMWKRVMVEEVVTSAIKIYTVAPYIKREEMVVDIGGCRGGLYV